jgi:hypothetical protein
MVTDAVRAQDDPDFVSISAHLDNWRSVQRTLASDVYDDPDWENGRLYFRNGYQQGVETWKHWKERGDWTAYVIEATTHGYTSVLFSSKGEREAHRFERVEAAFTRPVDAGKFVLARVGNMLRVSMGLDSLSVRWRRQGNDPRMRTDSPSADQLNYMLQICAGIQPGLLEQHLLRYSLADRTEVHALPLPSQAPMMNVLPLTFDELEALLLEGLTPKYEDR